MTAPASAAASRGAGALAWALLAACPLALLALSLDASARRHERARHEPAVSAVAARLPSSDLALSGGARWLRMPSLEEPGAAFQDGPALPDPDPGDGAMSPPRAVWAAEATAGVKAAKKEANPR